MVVRRTLLALALATIATPALATPGLTVVRDQSPSTAVSATIADLARPAMRVFTDRDGLPENAAMSLARGRDGALWVGTQDGLAHFDGRSWTVHNLPRRERSNFVRSVLAASDGSVWVGRENGGLARLWRGEWSAFEALAGTPIARVDALLETSDGGVWVGTQGAGIGRNLAGTWRVFDERDGLPSPHVRALAASREGGVLVGTTRGLSRVVGDRVTVVPLPFDGTISALLETTDARGVLTLWVGTANHGLYRRVGGAWSHLDRRSGLLGEEIMVLAESVSPGGDRVVWVGSDGGLVRLENGRFVPLFAARELPSTTVYSLLASADDGPTREVWAGFDGGLARLTMSGWSSIGAGEGLPASSVFAIAESRDSAGDGVWLGTRGAGIVHVADGRVRTFGRNEGLGADTVFALHETTRDDGKRALLIGLQGGGLQERVGDEVRTLRSPGTVRQLREARGDDGRREIIAATGGQGVWVFRGDEVRVLDQTAGLPTNQIFCTESSRGRDGARVLWVGMQGGGLARIDDRATTVFDTRNSDLPNDSVLSLHVSHLADGRQILWAGTEGGGIAWLPLWKSDARFSVIGVDTTPSLPNDTVYQVLEDARGRLYAFTNKGVARLSPRDDGGDPGRYAVDTFTTEDGLPGNEFNGGSGFVDSRGRIWAGGVSGVAIFDPASEVDAPPPPALRVISALRLDTGLPLTAGSALAHDDSSVGFRWAMPTLFRGDERRYRTELIGLDRGPSPWTADEKREYTALRDGSYELRVWARDHRGREAPPVTMAFSVRPAPWRSPLAWASYSAALSLLIYAAYRLRLRTLTRRNEALEATVLARTAELADKVRALAEEERRARAAEEEARAASRAKSVFLSTMSHELRTPLNAILGFAQLLGRDRDVSREQQGRVDVIQKSGEHLLGLINDVLSMAKIEAGKITIEAAPFDLAGTITATYAILRGRAEEKAIALNVELDSPLPHAVLGDEGKLRQILVNLVGNAIKFTDRGSVRLRARWADGVATIEVVDTGKGIAPDELARLFDAFSQSESGRRAREGTGLGLAISRSFARKMGGDITAESEVARGSTFRLEIALPEAAALAEDVRGPIRGLAAGQGEVRVLVVDDADAGRAVLRALLESVGFSVSEAANGKDAIRLHDETKPQATFLDMHLGDLDGDEVARAIRARESAAGARSALLALSASAFDDERDALLSAGCDAFLTKPFRADDVLDALARHAGVRYVRDDDPLPSSRREDASPDRLSRLPTHVRDSLLRAVVAGDVGASRHATDLVALHDAGLGAALRAMVDAFQLEEIESRIRSTPGPPA